MDKFRPASLVRPKLVLILVLLIKGIIWRHASAAEGGWDLAHLTQFWVGAMATFQISNGAYSSTTSGEAGDAFPDLSNYTSH